MCCSHSLISKLALAYGKAGESLVKNTSRDTGEGQSLGDTSQPPRKQDIKNEVTNHIVKHR